jgi:adenine-specific DNA-methyltransferase
MQRQIKLGLVEFRDDHTEPPFRKAHLLPVPEELDDENGTDLDETENGEDEEVGLQVMSSVLYKQSQVAVKYLRKLMGGKIFNNPKDHEVLARLIGYCMGNDQDGIVLDFFAGSGSTVEAVLTLNQRDGGRRKILAIQLPEAIEKSSAAGKAGYGTIADVCRERIRRVVSNIKTESALTDPSVATLGFRSLFLGPSNFKQWRGDGIEDSETLAGQIQMFVKTEKTGAQSEDILYELLLKYGQSLTTPTERIDVAGAQVYAVNGRKMLFVLDTFSVEMIEPLLALKPKEIITLDSVFHDSDELKSNLDLQCRDADIRFTCI